MRFTFGKSMFSGQMAMCQTRGIILRALVQDIEHLYCKCIDHVYNSTP